MVTHPMNSPSTVPSASYAGPSINLTPPFKCEEQGRPAESSWLSQQLSIVKKRTKLSSPWILLILFFVLCTLTVASMFILCMPCAAPCSSINDVSGLVGCKRCPPDSSWVRVGCWVSIPRVLVGFCQRASMTTTLFFPLPSSILNSLRLQEYCDKDNW